MIKKYDIYKTGWFKRLIGFGPWTLEVEFDCHLSDDIEKTYHENYDGAIDYFFDIYYYEL